MPGKLHFIALLPDASIQEEVTAFKKTAARRFGSSHALKSPPHITLYPPFRWEEEEVPFLEKALERYAGELQPFEVVLKGFDRFDSRVLFVRVLPSAELEGWHVGLKKALAQNLGLSLTDTRPFHPHMTVAFKDLRREQFPAAWAYFRAIDYERRFRAEALTLLVHREGRWHVQRSFPVSR